MITISPTLITAQIKSYDRQITIIEGRKNKLQGLLDDPEFVEELAGILGVLGNSNPTSSPENAVAAKDKPDEEEMHQGSDEKKDEENKAAEVKTGVYHNMQPSDATYALLSSQSKPGPFWISSIHKYLVNKGFPISGEPQDALEKFTICISQDKRLVCDLKAMTIAIRGVI